MHPEELAAGYIGRFMANQTKGLKNPEVMEKLMNLLLENKPYKDSWGTVISAKSALKFVLIGAAVLLVAIIALGICCYKKKNCSKCCYAALPDQDKEMNHA
jgi:hypothetical protein